MVACRSISTVWTFAGIGLFLLILSTISLRRVPFLRCLTLLAFITVLFNPSLHEEKRESVPGIVAVIVDESASQTLGDREAQTAAVKAKLETKLGNIPNLEVLNAEAIEIIEANAETVLWEIGVNFVENPAALERWRLEIDGIELGRFTACSGLSWNAEVVTYQATTEAGAIITQKRPGRVTFDDIVLKRGLSADDKLTKWFDKVKDGGVERKTGSIVLYSANGSEVDRYNFTNGWPSKWSASDLDAGKDDVVIEELTITHEFLERAAG